MLRELKASFCTWGWLPRLPLLVPFVVVVEVLAVRMGGAESGEFVRRIWNVYPALACVWPIVSLTEPLHPDGGEIFFAYEPRRGYWWGRTAFLIGAYSLLLTVVSAWALSVVNAFEMSAAGRVFLLATMYGWMGAAAMLFIRDASWAHFVCLGLLLVWMFGRLPDVLEWVNPHRFGREAAEGWFAMVFWIVIASAAAILRLHRRS